MTVTEEHTPESSRVAEWLRNDILDGLRLPGSKLVERDLADEFGVSRVPVRDALKILETEGLVTLRPRTWAVVREFTPQDVADLDEVRSALEVLVFRLAAQRCDDNGRERLRSILETEKAGARASNTVMSRRAAADFHEAATEIAGNELLSKIAESIRSRMRWLYGQHDDLLSVSEEHQALFDAVAQNDVAGAESLARAHVNSSRLHRDEHANAMREERVDTPL
ncbi:GntR family transcriptional regulator [Lysinibacter sp. HNR]|uniref:GntR family transcriptional regulator n=1 Tax=Lysinibacter sp. HNR TaxID=3031408 RepID=UPI00243607EE|nr:GntR family transcriptional regulator [Lysinibacter sp. HNR]WGD38091.1 GntR family transcriptional regulator [Lysinibacter sp. HNR]